MYDFGNLFIKLFDRFFARFEIDRLEKRQQKKLEKRWQLPFQAYPSSSSF